jgi:N-acetylglucosamine malate deacetylase 2
LNRLPQRVKSFVGEVLHGWVGARYRARLMERKPVSRSVTAPPAPKAVIIGAHPDDEVTGAGILLTQLPGVNLVQVTDGAPRNGRMAETLGFSGWEQYAKARRNETDNALAVAASNIGSISNIGIADQEAAYHLEPLTQKLMDILPGHDVVITHAYEGAHPDHDATALAVHAACRLLEQSGQVVPNIIEMMGYHLIEGREVFDRFLFHPDAGPVETLVLTPSQQALKRHMFECYLTQRNVLKHFPIKAEGFRRAPRYDFLRPPHSGTLYYERYGWVTTGRIWRYEAGRALRSLNLINQL